jgi:hypothetical protein
MCCGPKFSRAMLPLGAHMVQACHALPGRDGCRVARGLARRRTPQKLVTTLTVCVENLTSVHPSARQ